MADELEKLLAKRFIARTDVKAEQFEIPAHLGSYGYKPVRDRDQRDLPWTGQDIRDHVAGRKTYGHYVIKPPNLVKIVCFDLDIRKVRKDGEDEIRDWDGNLIAGQDNLNGAIDIWRGASNHVRDQLRISIQSLAEVLARRLNGLLDVPVCAAYSGSKGLHVYGLLELQAGEAVPAVDAREAARAVLDSLDGQLVESHGANFYRHVGSTFSAVEIEVFPKQDEIDPEAKNYGNLVRLPLGINRKTGERSFFIKFGPPPTEFQEMDAMAALNGELPWVKV